MNDERVLEEIVTKFLLNTCRLRPQLTRPTAEAVMRCAEVAGRHAGDDEGAPLIPLTTGSVAEFYIEPMLPHIGDIDVMYHLSNQLAIPRGHPPPTQLPAEFHNYVKVLEIIDSHLPGYVYLQLRYLLTECVEDGKYNAVKYDRQAYLMNPNENESGNIHGPAIVSVQPGNQLPTDGVYSVRCPVWPTQAAYWALRHRNYDWPESAIVDHVIKNGCDLVPVAHIHCRQHAWIAKHQFRLSFSRAEIVLINSWMPVQQIVYHMLRVFVKRSSDSADNSGAGTLSNYHIKTLMLWACEMKSLNWWTDGLNLVKICVQLLHILGDWLTDAQCQHYFINSCNLLNRLSNTANVGSWLLSVGRTSLSTWFVDNYIRRCFELCPDSVFRLPTDVSTTTALQNAVSAAVFWRLNNTLLDKSYVRGFMQHRIPECLFRWSINAQSCVCWMTELTKIDSCLSVYFTAVALLHVAYKSSLHGLNDELLDILVTVFGETIFKRHNSGKCASLLSLRQAVKMMKVVANKSLSTMSLIAIELSKAYLYRALRCKDYDSDSIYCLANVYLAVLCKATGQYQTAIDHCTLVMRSQDHSQCSSHVVQGDLMPKVDEDIDNMLGLAALYQHLRTSALNQHQTHHVCVCSAKLLVYFLSFTLCVQVPKSNEFDAYKICVIDAPQIFVVDVLLFLLSSRSFKYEFRRKPVCHQFPQPTNSPTELNFLNLVEMLQKSAIEYLTVYRQLEARDFGSLATIVTTDFEALYAYKRGDYQRCLQLSTQNVRALLYAQQTSQVVTYPAFIQLLDDDIVSLTALTLIVNPERHDHSGNVFVTQLTLSLYLITQCQLKLRHSVNSIAETLVCTKIAHRRHPVDCTLDRLVLKMIERKAMMYISTMINKVDS